MSLRVTTMVVTVVPQLAALAIRHLLTLAELAGQSFNFILSFLHLDFLLFMINFVVNIQGTRAMIQLSLMTLLVSSA